MTRVRNWWLMAAFLPLFPWVPACAQTSTTEFLPEALGQATGHQRFRPGRFEIPAAGAVRRISVHTFAEQATRKPHRASCHLSLSLEGGDTNFRQEPRRS